MIIDYKRGEEIYRDNTGQIIEIEKVYHVYHIDQENKNGVPNGKIGFICKNDYNEWFFYKNQYSDYFCGGLTLKETKENLEGIFKQGFHPFLKSDSITLKDYFN